MNITVDENGCTQLTGRNLSGLDCEQNNVKIYPKTKASCIEGLNQKIFDYMTGGGGSEPKIIVRAADGSCINVNTIMLGDTLVFELSLNIDNNNLKQI